MPNDSAHGRQWERIWKHFPEEHIPDGRAGCKPIPTRHVLEAVLWILNTGAQWHMLPQSYPNYKTVHRRFQTWCCNDILRRVLTDVANELRDKGALDRWVARSLVRRGKKLSVERFVPSAKSLQRSGKKPRPLYRRFWSLGLCRPSVSKT
jgi:transposase